MFLDALKRFLDTFYALRICLSLIRYINKFPKPLVKTLKKRRSASLPWNGSALIWLNDSFELAIEPHVECTEDVILDVFRVTNTATISFNFYESCASAVPCLRKLLQAHLQHLPREVSLRGQLTSSHVELSRPWAFEDGIGSTFDKSKMYTVQRPLGTLKRYIIKRMYISFG